MSRSRGTGRTPQIFSQEENFLVARWLSLAESAMAGSLRAVNQSSLDLSDEELLERWLTMAETALDGVLSDNLSQNRSQNPIRPVISQRELRPFLLSSLLDHPPADATGRRIVRMRSKREAA